MEFQVRLSKEQARAWRPWESKDIVTSIVLDQWMTENPPSTETTVRQVGVLWSQLPIRSHWGWLWQAKSFYMFVNICITEAFSRYRQLFGVGKKYIGPNIQKKYEIKCKKQNYTKCFKWKHHKSLLPFRKSGLGLWTPCRKLGSFSLSEDLL